MAGIARATIDYATTHSDGDTHTAPAQTKYVAAGGSTVFINGYAAVKQGDFTECGEFAVGCSGKVFIGGRGVHRLADALDAHAGSYSPSVCATASSNVFSA